MHPQWYKMCIRDSYNTLLEKQMHDAFFDAYEVICIVGTLNPNIEGIRFIPIEDLIINDTMDALNIYFRDYMREEEMKTFQQNILKNFSLSNIMNNLTILNPNKLLEHVADAIDKDVYKRQGLDCIACIAWSAG